MANFTAALIGHNRVRFTDASVRGTAAIAAHTWQFGDGGAASGSTTTHAYHAPGAFYVTEVTVDAEGRTSVAVHALTLTASKVVLGPRQSRITTPKPVAKPKPKHPKKTKKR